MASIQQSMNALSSALAGVATAGAYMYRQSDAYKASQADVRAKKITQTLPKEEEYRAMTPEQRAEVDARADAIVQQRTISAEHSPTEKRIIKLGEASEARENVRRIKKSAEMNDAIQAGEEARSELETERLIAEAEAYEEAEAERIDFEEGVRSGRYTPVESEEQSAPDPRMTREEQEQARAEEAVRNIILQDQRLVAINHRTEEYQSQLMEIRKQLKGGTN